MKVFISGASGFLGRAVSAELAAGGHQITGLVSTDNEGKVLEKRGCKHIVGDVLEGGQWCNAIKDADKVISLERPLIYGEDISDINVRAQGSFTERATNLFKAAAEGKARSFLMTYDILCYGARSGEWVSDADAVEPAGLCKSMGEPFKAMEKISEETGVGLVSIFPALVYGNGGWFKRIVDDIEKSEANIVEPGNNYLSLIHVDDLAGIYARIIDKVEGNETFVLADGRPVTQEELLKLVAALMGVREPRMVSFADYAKKNGTLFAETMSASLRAEGLKAIDTLHYAMKVRSYDKGIGITLESLGIKVVGKKAA
jgi:nucleoside-diphosphate-sugar epimerase